VILEVFAAERAPAVIWAIGLFSLLSLPSGVLISVRAQFGEMLEDKREIAESKRQERVAARGSSQGKGAGLLASPVLQPMNSDVEQVELAEAGKSGQRKHQRRE
jgi:hypothetical protein